MVSDNESESDNMKKVGEQIKLFSKKENLIMPLEEYYDNFDDDLDYERYEFYDRIVQNVRV